MFEDPLKAVGLLSRKLQIHVSIPHSLPASLEGTLTWEAVGVSPPEF